MNDKITFPKLASIVADRSGRSKRFSEDFLREFFSLISETLMSGESVKIKGLGTFRLSRVEPRKSIDVTTGQPMEISGHTKVVFIPAKDLAEAINAPFEAFTAIEISDGVDLSQLFTEDDIILQEQPDYATEGTTPPMENNDMEESENMILRGPEEDSIDNDEKTACEGSADESTEENIDDSPEEKPEDMDFDGNRQVMEEGSIDEPEDGEPTEKKKKLWKRILLVSFAAVIFALISTLAIWYVFASNDFNHTFNRAPSKDSTPEVIAENVDAESGKSEAPAVEDSLSSENNASNEVASNEETDVPTAPSDAIVYDTIGTTRYLTTMAKAHYGNFNLWPFIYEENKAKLGHPDRIRPGTPVVIPKLSKYGIDPKNKEDVEKAKKMGVEIYARYGKKIE